MTTAQLAFNLASAFEAKEAGRDQVTGTHPDFVPRLRKAAIAHAIEHGSVHIDDVRLIAERLGLRPRAPQAWGAIIRGRGWVKVGERPSALPSNHAHVSPVWAWRPVPANG